MNDLVQPTTETAESQCDHRLAEIEALLEEHDAARSESSSHRAGCDCAWCTATKTADALRYLLNRVSELEGIASS